jgi:hypothetical protein
MRKRTKAVGKALADKERRRARKPHKKDANSRIGELTRLRRAAERERDLSVKRTMTSSGALKRWSAASAR